MVLKEVVLDLLPYLQNSPQKELVLEKTPFSLDFSTITGVYNSLPLLRVIALQFSLPYFFGFTSEVLGKLPAIFQKAY